jgi:hypothetical protein
MFCAPGLFFGGTEGVGFLFHVLRSRTHFRQCPVRRVPFSCFALPDSFSAVLSASHPIFMFCAHGLIFGGTEGVGFLFHALRSRTHFQRYRGRRVPFTCFALPDSFSSVRRVSNLVFMFCAPGLIFGGTEGVGSHFHVLRSRNLFRRCRGRLVLFSCFAHTDSFSCFALSDSFSALQRTSGHDFMFCAPGLIFGSTDGVGSRFHVLRSRTLFRRCGVRRVPFSCFVLPDSFSAVTSASGPVFKFCARTPLL